MKHKCIFSKTHLFSLAVLVVLLNITPCLYANVGGGVKAPTPQETCIVFIDKSGSVNVDQHVTDRSRKLLAGILAEHVTKPGDAMVVSFIYEQTDNKANQYVFTYKPPLPRDKKMSSNEARLEKIRYNQRLRSYTKSFADQVIEKAFATAPSRKQTDIVGSIPKMFDLVVSDSSRMYSVYYFSDMVESSGFRYMTFSSSGGINSLVDAEQLAKSDFPRIIKRYNLNQNCLSCIREITVFFPAIEMDMNKAFSVIPGYWDYIFHQLGVKTINYL